jgi:hypothetical protein
MVTEASLFIYFFFQLMKSGQSYSEASHQYFIRKAEGKMNKTLSEILLSDTRKVHAKNHPYPYQNLVWMLKLFIKDWLFKLQQNSLVLHTQPSGTF